MSLGTAIPKRRRVVVQMSPLVKDTTFVEKSYGVASTLLTELFGFFLFFRLSGFSDFQEG